MRSGAGEVLGVLLWPVVRCIGLRSRSAGSVLLIGLVGGFAPAAAATAEASPLPYTVNRPFASRRHSLFSSKNNTVQKCSISIRSPLRYTAGRL